ncbi:hypothetical protein KIPB_001548 [Kipferlia bialata]|uniref:PH domain-containing protein n=1 Tax=Kipferlia bialata TaxID=797122 RepID=A0A9K3CR01_9EUKA|nr:hypothetical protein KIPB_001548 [Kipferlia bialata]|eukprot:g1548.t1
MSRTFKRCVGRGSVDVKVRAGSRSVVRVPIVVKRPSQLKPSVKCQLVTNQYEMDIHIQGPAFKKHLSLSSVTVLARLDESLAKGVVQESSVRFPHSTNLTPSPSRTEVPAFIPKAVPKNELRQSTDGVSVITSFSAGKMGGKMVKHFQSRFFVLSSDCLRWFKSETAYKGGSASELYMVLVSEIDDPKATDIDGSQPYGIEFGTLRVFNAKRYLLAFADRAERDRVLQALTVVAGGPPDTDDEHESDGDSDQEAAYSSPQGSKRDLGVHFNMDILLDAEDQV